MATLGPGKLGEFLGKNGISKRRAAKDLGVSAPTLWHWIEGDITPEPVNRAAIAVYTHGEVVESDWVTQKEIGAAERVAKVRPYEPPPPQEKRSESGEMEAVTDAPPSSTGTDE